MSPKGAAGSARTVATGLALGGVAIAAAISGPMPLFLFLLALAIVAAGELFRLSRKRGVKPVPLAGFAGIIALFSVAYVRGERAPTLFPAIVAASVGLTFVAMLARKRRSGVTLGIATTVLAILYVGMLGAYIVVLRRGPHGFRVLLAFGAMAVLNDVGSFVAGRRHGRRPMAPSASPAKTWEGWAGGAALTLAAGAASAIWLDPPFTWPAALVLALLVSVAAPLGDLAESLLKRDMGVADAGSILPGHGGVLDRIDSLVVSAPVFFYAFRVLAR